MENELLGIGRMASLSGLTISALRFYDGANVLTPVTVDPTSGYRFYAPAQVSAARLIAHLRRVSLPLDDIRTVLAEPGQATGILAAHLDRLEAGLADARREISIVHRLLERPETTMISFTLSAPAFVRALREVRYAVSTDPELPMLHGVFLDTDDTDAANGTDGTDAANGTGRLTVVATDRYRLAVSTIPAPTNVELHALLPTSAVDDCLAGFSDSDLDITIDAQTITLTGSGHTVTAQLPDVAFPHYRTWTELGRDGITFDAAELRRSVLDGPVETRIRDNDGASYDLTVLSVGSDRITVGGEGVQVGVNREFLLQALDAGDQLTLGLDGPIAPLAIRNPGRDGGLALLMPVRLD